MRGRRPSLAGAVAALGGPRVTRERLRVLLATLAGDVPLATAGEQLGVGRTQVLALRRQALVGALDALTPQPVGRPPRVTGQTAPEVARLQARVRELEVAVEAARVRTEIALTLPWLLRRGGGKKDPRRRTRRCA